MRYPRASTEPLETIRVNECEVGDASLATKRFQALWNEIEALRGLLIQARDYGNRGHALSDDFLDEIDAAVSRS